MNEEKHDFMLPGVNGTTVRCGGVLEHFNHPWVMASRDHSLKEEAGIDLQWRPYPEGTGDMCRALRSGELDVAVLLTEGAVRDILYGGPQKILTFYTRSPIVWGVHTASSFNISKPSDLPRPSFAISRHNSGSHLMACVYAAQIGWDLKALDFKVVYGLEGARNILRSGAPRLFLWEKYSTMPFVRNGEFRLIDECPTPWPSTVVVVREDFMLSHSGAVNAILDNVRMQVKKLLGYMATPSLIAGTYGLLIRDVEEWLSQMEWTEINELDMTALMNVSRELFNLGLLPEQYNSEELRSRLFLQADRVMAR